MHVFRSPQSAFLLWVALSGCTPADAPTPVDADGDGVAAGFLASSDCDDERADVFPGAAETCDGVDQDCNGLVDDDATDASVVYPDADMDGFGDAAGAFLRCDDGPANTSTKAGDCDDDDPAVYGDEEVIYDGADNDCDPETVDAVCGDTAPVLATLDLSTGMFPAVFDERLGAVRFQLAGSDVDGDLFAHAVRFWVDDEVDGQVDPERFTYDTGVYGGHATDRCHYTTYEEDWYIQLGSLGLEENTTYDFAVQLVDPSGRGSNILVVTGIAPYADGSPGDGSGAE